MNPDGPYLSVASLCDVLLEEKDDRLSLIRLMDRANIVVTTSEPLPADQPQEVAVTVKGLVSLKSGKFKGKKEVTVSLRKPDGELAGPVQAYPLLFEGGEHGPALRLTFLIGTTDGGLYWFEIGMDEETITKIPLRIAIERRVATDGTVQNQA